MFQNITPASILNESQDPSGINMNLVQAQETRRVLDRLAGYTMSPLLWRKIAGELSACRVQSVTLALIVKRGAQRLLFRRAGYASCIAQLIVGEGNSKTLMQAALAAIDDKPLVCGSDFEDAKSESTYAATERSAMCLGSKTIQQLLKHLCRNEAKVSASEKRMTTQSLLAPLIRSTLQQEYDNKLDMDEGDTMQVSQQLYEKVRITYMRTDNPNVGEKAEELSRGNQKTATERSLFGMNKEQEEDRNDPNELWNP